MPVPGGPSEVSLRIKVPPGYLQPASAAASSTDSELFSLGSVPVTTTLASLRSQIQQIIPTNPPPERQRILYGGRALVDNEQSVGDALNVKRDPAQGEYVIHLLIKGDEAGVVRTPTPTSMASGGHARPGNAPLSSQPAGLGGHMPQHQPQHQPVVGHNPVLFEQQRLMIEQHRALTRQLEMQRQHASRLQMQPQSHAGPTPPHLPTQTPPQVSVNGLSPAESQPDPHAPQSDAGRGQQISGQPPAEQQTLRQPQLNQQQQLSSGHPTGQGFHIQGVGPDGQRFQIHQQTLNFPANQLPPAMPGQHVSPMPFNLPGMMPQGMPMPPLPSERPANGPSALDRARENMAEMRRMLDELATQTDGASDESRRRNLEEVQRRARSLNEYIDPFSLHANLPGNARPGETAATAPATPQMLQTLRASPSQNAPPSLPRGLRVVHPQAHPRVTWPPPQGQSTRPSTSSNEVAAYLLSSPQGPQALLFSPEHGTYTGAMPITPLQRLSPVPGMQQPQHTPHQPGAAPQANLAVRHPADAGVPAELIAEAARQNLVDAANAQQAGGQDPLGMQALLGHFWLLFRILIFAYFILGANTNWWRPVILAGIGLGFWLFRMGALGDGGLVRRWWEGVMGAPRRAQEAQGERAPVGQNEGPPVPPAPRHATGTHVPRPAPMPTPEQLAQRLLNEAETRHDERRHWLRERLRPVERAMALFLASLWPGIGEGYVREQRRLREEAEAEARRQAGEEEAARSREAAETEGTEAGASDGAPKTRVEEKAGSASVGA